VALAVSAEVTVTDLRVENMASPLGLDTNQPRFSWKIVSDEQNVVQTAYEIVVDYLRRRPSSQWPILRMDANDNDNVNVNENVNTQHPTPNTQHPTLNTPRSTLIPTVYTWRRQRIAYKRLTVPPFAAAQGSNVR